jgi:hypothetical protein
MAFPKRVATLFLERSARTFKSSVADLFADLFLNGSPKGLFCGLFCGPFFVYGAAVRLVMNYIEKNDFVNSSFF